jgi:hypothetical protein
MNEHEQFEFDIDLALRKVPLAGFRGRLSEGDRKIVAKSIADFLRRSNWVIERGPPVGHYVAGSSLMGGPSRE